MNLLRKASVAAAVTVAVAVMECAFGGAALAGNAGPPSTPWTVEVDRVNAGTLNLAPEFEVAIYENLMQELPKTRRFSAVLRTGDVHASEAPRLVILKTNVESYTPGSETKRAVTTVAGATKLKVRVQLCTREGQVLFERVVEGNVRFFGGNLRATENLARAVAKAIEQSALPNSEPPPHA